jgi:hypothetical protein
MAIFERAYDRIRGAVVLRLVIAALFVAAAAAVVGCGGNRHEFRQPIEVDFDMADIPEPEEDEPSQYYDFVDRTFFKEAGRGLDLPRQLRKIPGNPKQAINVDAFGGVANSSWYTNRNGRRRMSLDEIRRGPGGVDGPVDGVWTVVRGKTQGVTPGFTIKDPNGDRYLIKFDPPQNPEMSTAAEVISTKLFHAMGYNVPQNTIVHFSPDRLVVDPEAKFVDKLGNKRRMTEGDLRVMLTAVARREDGTFRAVASKFLAGKPKGPYSYIGKRKDDPNDIYRHEHRRDLRGLRIMAAWLQHNDVRRINSLDMYVAEDGRSFLKHHLIDFGATLGSASLFANSPSEGLEYQFDTAESLKSLFTLGVYKRPWLDAGGVEHPSVGYIESELFDPANWKANYPIPAFQNMTSLDAYWAAKIVMSFTDDQIRAAVEMGQLTDKEAEAYLVRILIERRDKIGRYWYGQVNPLDHFSLEASTLVFDDLAVDAGFEDPSSTSYRYRFVHNACRGTREIMDDRPVESPPDGRRTIIDLGGGIVGAAADAVVDSGDDCDKYFFVEIETRRGPSSKWGKHVRVHMVYHGAERGFAIVGVEHEG